MGIWFEDLTRLYDEAQWLVRNAVSQSDAGGATAQSGKLRWRCRGKGGGERKMCYQTTDPSKPVRAASGATKKPQKAVIFRRTVGGKTTILVTAAQNATPISRQGFVNSA